MYYKMYSKIGTSRSNETKLDLSHETFATAPSQDHGSDRAGSHPNPAFPSHTGAETACGLFPKELQPTYLQLLEDSPGGISSRLDFWPLGSQSSVGPTQMPTILAMDSPLVQLGNVGRATGYRGPVTGVYTVYTVS